jgi:hypothetical protein
MQLVAYGAQDIYLTGNPQITFFKVVYRRHTNFSMESIQQTINGASTSAGGSGTVTISRNGDLVSKVYVASSSAGLGGVAGGEELVSEVELEIGGQRIDRHYKEWNQVWAELTVPESKALGFKNMTGSFANALHLAGTHGPALVQVPLNFWFCRNPGLALPLIALQYHEVKLKFTWGTTTTTATCEVWADYIYLDTDERRRFAQVSHEYLIEQLQKQSASATTSQKLNFNHPVKELIWTSGSINTYDTAQLKLNGHDRFAAQQEEYFQLRQPYDYHTAIPGTNIDHSDDIRLIQPIIVAHRDTGTVTGDANATLHNEVSATDGAITKVNLIIGRNFITSTTAFNCPRVGDLVRYKATDAGETDHGHVETFKELCGQVITAPVDGTNSITFTIAVHDDNDAIATAFSVSTAAHDSVDCEIIARVQNGADGGRCSNFVKKINVYSFALKPEEHQPSGTCNFSRIDNAKLDTAGALDADDNIYAVNYNVLRIMSGMGGLAYSN